jgi:hypothetical protein
MGNSYKAIKKIMEIIKISGFYITFKGDPEVGIFDSIWELKEDFYFDNKEELEDFRKELKTVFDNYCGFVKVETFEEVAKQIGDEDQAYYEQFPVRYFIRDKGYGFDTYKQADHCATYSSDVGTAIHFELPRWIPENGDTEHIVIKSTDPEFKQILLKAAGELEREISHHEWKLKNARKNLNLIKKELKYGKK